LFVLSCAAQSAQTGVFEDLLKRGSTFNQQADFVSAIPLLRQATQLEPQNPSANFLLGVALLQSGHPADAIDPLKIALRAIPVNEAAEGNLGDAAMELGKFALAAEIFQNAAVRSPGSEQTLLWWTDFSLERYRALAFSLRASPRGRAALLLTAAESGKGRPATTEPLLRQAAGLNPAINGIWGELGVAQVQLGQEAVAEASLRKALERQPEASSTLELEAMVDAAHGAWTEAHQRLLSIGERSTSELQRMLSSWPLKLVPGVEVSGTVWQCLRQGTRNCAIRQTPNLRRDNDASRRLFDEERWEQLAALPAPSQSNTAEWFWRGLALARLGDCSHAIPALERGLPAGEETAASWLTSCYESAAVQTAEQLNAQGKDGAVHEIRGNILLSIRLDAAQAVGEYKEALSLKPKDQELLEKLAEAYFSLGNMESARQSAEEALTLNPHRAQLLRLLIKVAMSERDYPSALSLLGRLAEAQPEDAWMRVQQGTAYTQTGQPEEAVERLKLALDAGYPDEKGALHALLAGQLRKLGRDKDAKSASDEAVKLADAYQQQAQNKPDEPH
jgi:tetratricopeptide (TPR) repeat protein